ncbi:MAG TPA: hypothetical protein VGA95_13020 [Thermodesulfobacteriota bacterium]
MAEIIKDEDTSVDSVRRRLLKIGIYSVPAIMFLGKVKVARASNGPSGSPYSPSGPPFSPPGPPPNIPPR